MINMMMLKIVQNLQTNYMEKKKKKQKILNNNNNFLRIKFSYKVSCNLRL